ncbi:class I adenylate-forming enzyme family protein [Streptomyces sp. NPDC056661]|uniref:class I adenylate-forming enzyme family protein n=1 Tax=Streptomyces sp. NPDC056661 TaxID=3345898 RepID=UPI0036C0FBEB
MLDPAGRTPGLLLHDLLAWAAESRSEQVAVRDDETVLTYGDLWKAAMRTAGWLLSRGVCAGDRVLVRLEPSRRIPILLYGCSLIGAAMVPVSPTLSRAQWQHVRDDCQPTLVVVEPMSAHTSDGVVDTGQWDVEAEAANSLSHPATNPDEVALLIYTSGSTAMPKAVVSKQHQVMFAVRAIGDVVTYFPTDTVFCRLPLSFDYGLYQVLLCTQVACELVIAGRSENAAIVRAIQRSRATVVPVVPTMATMITALARRGVGPSAVRLFTNTGDRLPAAVIEKLRRLFPGAAVQPMYGTTECKRISVLEPDGDRVRPDSVGRPLPGTEVHILGTGGAVLPPGQVGEIAVRGGHVMAGYWRSPELTGRTFRDDEGVRTLRTGDYGWIDANGYLYFVGRRDHIFKVRGVRTSVAEIEAAAHDVPGITAAAVLPPAGNSPAVLCIVSEQDKAVILERLAARLDASRIPEKVIVVPELPLGTSGKVDRAALRRELQAG